MDRFYLKAFGCKVNQYDGQGLRERLVEAGYVEADHPEIADLIVMNFCVVTARSASRCHRALNGLLRRRPGARVLIAGCLAPEDRSRVRAACPEAIFLDDPDASETMEVTGLPLFSSDSWQHVSGLLGHTRAFVKIQDGCNLRCAYCIIPSIRGNERSRPAAEISKEVGRLLEAGYLELVLCGIRLGAYRQEDVRLEGLLRIILRDHYGPFRIRLSSLNPAEVTTGLLDVIAQDRRVARHLHLPLQSGDPEILKRMRRPYSPVRFLEKIAEIRQTIEDPAITTDLMVGFPGEDDGAFRAGLDVLEQARVSRVHVFPFSPRKGTEAASMPQVADRLKTERTREALEMARRLKDEFNLSFIGKEASVLVERTGSAQAGTPSGLTSRYQKAAVCGLPRQAGTNTFVRVVLDHYKDGLFTGSTVPEGSNERPRRSGEA